MMNLGWFSTCFARQRIRHLTNNSFTFYKKFIIKSVNPYIGMSFQHKRHTIPSYRYKTDKAPITVEESLRKLYLKVHPDFFSAWEDAQLTNEQSFQELMNYMDFMDNSISTGQATTHKVWPISFYLKSQTDPDDPSSEVTLKKISVELSSSFTSEGNTILFAQDLANLFDLCSVDHSVGTTSSTFFRSKSRDNGEFSLLLFTKKVYEKAKSLSETQLKIERNLDLERSIIYFQHRLKVFCEFPENLDWKQKIDMEHGLLQKLDATLKSMALERGIDIEKFANSTIMFGRKQGIDFLGRICLNVADDPSQWIEDLEALNIDKIAGIRSDSALRFEQEKAAGEAFKIAYFYTDYTLGNLPRYRQFLQSITKYAKEIEPPTYDDMYPLKIRILNESEIVSDGAAPETSQTSTLDSADWVYRCSSNYDVLSGLTQSDPKECIVSMPMNVHPSYIIQWINKNGLNLLDEYDKYYTQAEELNSLLINTKRKFRLRTIHWDQDLSNQKLTTCLNNLMRYSHGLSRYLDGQRILISDTYLLDPTDGTIHIKWDFII